MSGDERPAEDDPDGGLPPRAEGYDLRTGEPLPSQRQESDPLPTATDLGIWAPSYVPPEPPEPWGAVPPPEFGEPPPAAPTADAAPPAFWEQPTHLGQLPPYSGPVPPPPAAVPSGASPPRDPNRRWGRVLLAGGTAALVVMVGVIAALLIIKSGSTTPTTQVAHRAPATPAARTSSQVTAGPTSAPAPLPPGPTAGPVQPSVVPSPATSPLPAGPTRHAQVLAPSGTTTVYGVAGPSLEHNAGGQLTVYPTRPTPVAVGSFVDIICTAYGSQVDLGSLGSGNLWDYTSDGWFSDQALQTNSSAPVANACTGNVADPTEGSTQPSPSTGPFPIYSGGSTVSVQSDPSTSAESVSQLNDGDFVTLTCTATGDDVSAPSDLTGTPIGDSTQWDELQAADTEWVPDALVNSASEDSVAPGCS